MYNEESTVEHISIPTYMSTSPIYPSSRQSITPRTYIHKLSPPTAPSRPAADPFPARTRLVAWTQERGRNARPLIGAVPRLAYLPRILVVGIWMGREADGW